MQYDTSATAEVLIKKRAPRIESRRNCSPRPFAEPHAVRAHIHKSGDSSGSYPIIVEKGRPGCGPLLRVMFMSRNVFLRGVGDLLGRFVASCTSSLKLYGFTGRTSIGEAREPHHPAITRTLTSNSFHILLGTKIYGERVLAAGAHCEGEVLAPVSSRHNVLDLGAVVATV